MSLDTHLLRSTSEDELLGTADAVIVIVIVIVFVIVVVDALVTAIGEGAKSLTFGNAERSSGEILLINDNGEHTWRDGTRGSLVAGRSEVPG